MQDKNTGYIGINLSIKQLRKIMSDHNLHGKNRSGLPYKKEKRGTNQWTEKMDLLNGNFKNLKTPVISMDIKYVKTKEGYIYFNWVKDLHSQAIIGSVYGKTMSYQELVKPSIEQA